MKLGALKQGDIYKYAQFPDGGSYVKGSEVPGTAGTKFYAHSRTIGFIYQSNWDDEVIRIGNINEE